ncbi:hypothetical protein BASA81_003212 [Batrachochytrium salamandrivorans]|nr:hypothetical protein BASA81_003212 [Batrachochytrium salamandrivorans]
MLSKLVFRAPRPATYSMGTLPHVDFACTQNNHWIPVCYSNSWNHPPFLDPTGGGLWILFSHGNSEDLGNVSYWADYLSHKLHIPVVAYDYSGYGISSLEEGGGEAGNGLVATEEDVYLDCEAAMLFAETTYGLRRDRCIVWGRSLGCSASVHLATTTATGEEPEVAGMILQSGFASVLAVGTSSLWDSSYDMFRNYDKLMRHPPTFPVFIIHGRLDKLVSVWHATQMELAIPASKLWPTLIEDQIAG